MPGLTGLPALPPDVLDTGEPVRVYLAPDEAGFRRLTGGLAPEWGAGIAFPARGVVVLPAYASRRGNPLELARVLRHELAHVALERYLGPARIPRWFHEGFARWAAGEFDFEGAWMLRLSFALHRAPPLDSLTLGWPQGAADARVAYLLAASAVRYLDESGGEYGLRRLLERWREAGRLDPAFRETYGVTLGQFEEDWKEWVKDRYGWAVFLSNTLVFWGFATVLLMVLYMVRRRRDRARMERLRAEEPPDRPAYWLGEPPEGWHGELRPDDPEPPEPEPD